MLEVLIILLAVSAISFTLGKFHERGAWEQRSIEAHAHEAETQKCAHESPAWDAEALHKYEAWGIIPGFAPEDAR